MSYWSNAPKDDIPVHVLLSRFYICPQGRVRYKHDNVSKRAGEVAGYLHKRRGTWLVTVMQSKYPLDRIAWAMHHGSWPPSDRCVDHIDGCDENNSKSNLRLADKFQIAQHRPRVNPTGVTFHEQCKKWQVQIKVKGRSKYIGLFDSKNLAESAYRIAARKYHGDFRNVA